MAPAFCGEGPSQINRRLKFIGAKITRIEAGAADIQIPYQKALTQQNGFIHAGIITTIADSACGYAAYSLMPKGADVLSVEFKVNLLSPAIGDKFLAEAHVVRAGKTLTIVQGDVFAITDNQRKHVAIMLATMMCLRRD